MRTALLAVALAFAFQVGNEPEGTPTTVVVELGGEAGVERTWSFRAPAEGRLFFWAAADQLDPAVRLESSAGIELARDEDSGGGTSAFLSRDVHPDEDLTLTVVVAPSEVPSTVRVHTSFGPATDATRAATRLAEERRAEVADLRSDDPEAARALAASTLTELAETPGAVDSEQVVTWAAQLAMDAYSLGAAPAALRGFELDLAFRRIHYPETHRRTLDARTRVMGTRRAMGRLDEALVEAREIVQVRSRILEPGDRQLLVSRMNLAVACKESGHFIEARDIEEDILDLAGQHLAEDDDLYLKVRVNLASTLYSLSDYHQARELLERVVEIRSARLPDEDPELIDARSSLAGVCQALGDLETARTLLEGVLEVEERTLPAEHFRVIRTRGNLAMVVRKLGDFDRGLALHRQALEASERIYHPESLRLQEDRNNFGFALMDAGRYEEARPYFEQSLEVVRRTAPDSPTLLYGLGSLIQTTIELGDEEACRAAVDELLERMIALTSSWAVDLGPREIEARVADHHDRLGQAISIARGGGRFEPSSELTRKAFECSESMRSVGLLATDLVRQVRDDPEAAALLERVGYQRQELARLVRTGAGRDEISEARRRRDATQRELLALASPSSAATSGPLGLEELSAALGPGEAAVAFWRTAWMDFSQSERKKTERMIAFVVGPRAALGFFDLGPIEAVEQAALRWRAALGAGPALPSRGVGLSGEATDASEIDDAARDLARLVLEPLLPALEGRRRLFVALDDQLHLVPLEALPVPGGEQLVGDRWRVSLVPALRELLRDLEPPTDGGLVTLGGVAYGEGSRFEPLPASEEEVLGIAQLARGHEIEAEVLRGEGATREALVAGAPGARWLHLATHGWYAPESFADGVDERTLDSGMGLGTPMSRSQQVQTMSPMLLAGVALAGSREVSAEELSSLDLRGCELAVLSACDSNVGQLRGGQGVSSLQQALHMAGARSVITSLWKVPDESTRDLMLRLYTRLWVRGEPVGEALWQVKREMRMATDAEGRPAYHPRDWAGWVLTGATP